jgi:hypothetical protein
MPLPFDNSKIDITNPSHLAQLISEIESDENISRKKEAWISYQCLEGNQLEYVEERLQELYPKTWPKFRKSDISLVKKVDKKIAKAYKSSPMRKLQAEKETKELNRIYDSFKFDRALKDFDRYYNQHKYAAFWLNYVNPKEDEIEGKYVLRSLQPFEYDVVLHEVTYEPIIFSFSYPDVDVTDYAGSSDGIDQAIADSMSDVGQSSKRFSFWDNANFVRVRSTIRKDEETKAYKRDIQILEVKPHGLDRLPFGFLSREQAPAYPIGANLHKQSIEFNVAFSDLKTAAAHQGHGQLVIKHPEGQKMAEAHMGMHTAINLPQSNKPDTKPTEAQYISASPDLGGQLDVLKFDLVNVLDEHGIKAKGAIEGGVEQFSSGLDRLFSEADTQDIIEDNQNLYAATIEQELYGVLKSYENAMNKPTFKSEELEIYFEKPKVMISDKETLENIKLREELGLILPHEKHQIINPNLSEEEAKRRVEEIAKLQKERLKEMMAEEGEDEESPEDEKEDAKEDESEDITEE